MREEGADMSEKKDLKEALIELIDKRQVYGIDNNQPKPIDIVLLDNEELADHLIENGVVIIDPQKYPPVTNRGIIDTVCGMPLDEVADLIKAKQEGRVVVMPCKVGDSIFQIEKKCLECPNYTDGGYSDWCECVLDDNKIMFEVDFDKDCIYEIFKTRFIYSMIDQIGKTVFLTCEEAEKALAERVKHEK